MKVENVTCPLCGTLCDDIVLQIENGQIEKAKGACANGRAFLLNYRPPPPRPRVDEQEVDWSQAIAEAAQILIGSTNPLIFGLSSTACEAQRKAVELADLVGACIDSTSSTCHGPTTLGIQAVGEASCTLGEVKNRADLVIFWGCNPAEAHPRHFVRYSVTPRGLYTPGGRKDRTVVLVDVRRTASARVADIFLQVRPGYDFEVLTTLRALLKGYEIEGEEIGGVPVAQLKDLVERMKGCRYGIIFFGMGVTMTRGRHLNTAELLVLVTELNQYTKFSVMPMRGHGNVAGADLVLTWQTGYPFAISFGRGYPQYNPGEFTAVDLLAREEVDAALIIASDPAAHFPQPAARYLGRIPTIVFDAGESLTTRLARVWFPTALYGLTAAGTAYRMDNVPLPLKKVVDSPQPNDEEILERIIARVKSQI